MNTTRFLSTATACLLIATSVQAADTTCSALAKAASAALAQSRIHAAIDAPLDPEARQIGMTPTLMHSIVIDRVQYSNAMRASFSRMPLESTDMRLLAADLGPFTVEEGCKPAGSERIAGRDAQVVIALGDLGRGEIRLRLWIDKATGLPLRAVSDEPDVDVDTMFDALDRKKGRPSVRVSEQANGKRRVATHAYLFGDAVKPPGPQGALDSAALATLRALLKGAP